VGNNTIPRSPAEITPAWLTGVLRETNVIGDANIVSITTEAIGAGAGFLGQLARLNLTYDRDEAGAPGAVIAKLPALDPGGRGVANAFRFYEREIRFYEDVAADTHMSIPRRYYSAMDVEGDEYLLLLEDMAPAVVGDEAPGGDNPTPDQDIVDEIGRAVGVEYQDNEELKGEKKISQRDKHRWELDPASSDDWEDR